MQARPRWPGLTQSTLVGALSLPLVVWLYVLVVSSLDWPPRDSLRLVYLSLWTVVAGCSLWFALQRTISGFRNEPFEVIETADGPLVRVRQVSRRPLTVAVLAAAVICILAFPDHGGDMIEGRRGGAFPLGIGMAIVIGLGVVGVVKWPAARPFVELSPSGIAVVDGRGGFACPWDEVTAVGQEDVVVRNGLIADRSPSMQVHITRDGTRRTHRFDPAAFHVDAHELLRLIARLSEAGTREQRVALLREAPSLTA